MEKLQRDINELVDDVPIPKEKLNQTVSFALEHGRNKKKSSLFKTQKFFAGIASIFVLAIAAVLFNASYSDNKDINSNSANRVFYSVHDDGLQRLAKEGNVQDLFLEAEDQGIKVILEQGYLDNHQMSVSYRLEIENETVLESEDVWVNTDLTVNGMRQTSTSYGGMKLDDLVTKGDMITYYNTKGYPDVSEIELKIYSISEIQGNWNFTFHLQKEDELLVKNDLIPKVDAAGNSIRFNYAELTPSMLKIGASTRMNFENPFPPYSYLVKHVLAIGEDGYIYLPQSWGSSSNNQGAFGEVGSSISYSEEIEVARGFNTYKYKIVPYIETYKGEMHYSEHGDTLDIQKITVPLTIGSVIEMEAPIEVLDIQLNEGETVIFYNMEVTAPRFPIIRAGGDELTYEAIAFKQHEDYVEVRYPKVEPSEHLELFMFEATYTAFPELEMDLDFK